MAQHKYILQHEFIIDNEHIHMYQTFTFQELRKKDPIDFFSVMNYIGHKFEPTHADVNSSCSVCQETTQYDAIYAILDIKLCSMCFGDITVKNGEMLNCSGDDAHRIIKHIEDNIILMGCKYKGRSYVDKYYIKHNKISCFRSEKLPTKQYSRDIFEDFNKCKPITILQFNNKINYSCGPYHLFLINNILLAELEIPKDIKFYLSNVFVELF